MILTHDQITANHGSCLAILRNALGIGCFLPHIASEAIKVVEEMDAHDNAVCEAMADESVDFLLYRGDACGYLAAQCKARMDRGLRPTAEQREAWLHDNTNEVKL